MKGLPHSGVIRGRLAEARRKCLGPVEAERYVLGDIDLEALTSEERRTLAWICENVVWPVTRRKRRLSRPEQGRLFT